MANEFQYSGELVSERGLEPVAEALANLSWPIELRRSGYDGTLYLRHGMQPEIDLEMQSGQSRCFLFSGIVEGTLPRALELIGDFSRCLRAGGFVHRVEVYDDTEALVGYFHEGWPEGQHSPSK